MVQRVSTVAFEGIEARAVDVQVQVAPGLPAFAIVGLPDKAVSEARERVRSALIASGLALPARRIIVNLAPADLPKEGSHYDLPIALGLMAAIGAIPPDALTGFTVLGELGLDGSIAPVAGVLPAAIGANVREEGLICPAACGSEAAWASPDIQIVAAHSLIQIANHFKGTQVLSRPVPKVHEAATSLLDLRDIKGQESAKRALEIAAAGGHHLLMIGAPGAGKSMLAARLPSILPPLSPGELLEVSMIASVAGEIEGGALTSQRPFRSPHHSASMAALTGGGARAKPGEISLAHQGVLFLDELPESLFWTAGVHVAFTDDLSRATVRVQITDDADAADFAVVDDGLGSETESCQANPATRLITIAAQPVDGGPVIYLSTDGPADYRIYVRSKTLSQREAAALIVGVHGGHPPLPLQAASL